MSGGYFEYKQYAIDCIADQVEQIIIDQGNLGFKKEVVDEIKKGYETILKAATYAQRIDWLLSGDDGEENFLKRLYSDLEKCSEKSKEVFEIF
jgi:hypothetical protein